MENYSRDIFAKYIADLQTASKHILETPVSGVKLDFNKDYALFLIEIAKRVGKSYTAVGTLNFLDLIEEVNLLFFKYWNNIDWNKVELVEESERQFYVWGYLKKSIRLGLVQVIRNTKDGVRIPLYKYNSNDLVSNSLTLLFPNFFDSAFQAQIEEIGDYKTEIFGEFLDLTLDKYLDRTFKGARNNKSIERSVIRLSYGLDCKKKSLDEIAKYYGKSVSDIQNIKFRAIKRLQNDTDDEWMEKAAIENIAYFVCSNSIPSSSDVYKWAAEHLAWGSNEGRKSNQVELSNAMKNKLKIKS